jgi:hypothetical protein
MLADVIRAGVNVDALIGLIVVKLDRLEGYPRSISGGQISPLSSCVKPKTRSRPLKTCTVAIC